MTHWDHPEMVELFRNITELNSVRFSAYRMAMKLREVQKKLACEFQKLNHIFKNPNLNNREEKKEFQSCRSSLPDPT